jgi:hypothetical protein
MASSDPTPDVEIEDQELPDEMISDIRGGAASPKLFGTADHDLGDESDLSCYPSAPAK